MTAINLANSEIERIMCTQSESFMKDKLSKQHWDNLQDSDKIIAPTLFNQYAWKRKNTLGKGGFVCVMFMDLSKAFDTMNSIYSLPS